MLKIGILKCTINSITMTGCHFIYTFYKIDESMFHTLYEKVYNQYEKVMNEKIQTMITSLEKEEEELLKDQEEDKKQLVTREKKIANSMDNIAKKRAAIETMQNTFKKIKH